MREAEQPKAILLATGAFSPIHRGHLQMFQQAKDYLESQGYLVEKGYISPKHNDYIRHKIGADEFMDIEDRLAMIKKSIADAGMDWLEPFDWEARQPTEKNKSYVVQQIKQLHPEIEVMFVCGEDNCQLKKYPGIAKQGGFSWVATPRGGLSSTRVRTALGNSDEKELDLLLHPGVKSHLANMGRYKPTQ